MVVVEDAKPLFLIRHGATKLNNDDVSVDRIRGWKDVPLSPDGKREAKLLAEKMERTKELPAWLASSDLERAQETAWIISKELGIPLKKITQHFRPWDVGRYAGMLTKEAIPILQHYAEQHPLEDMPEGECFCRFKCRFFEGVAKLLEDDKPWGVVTHHRGERLMHAWLARGARPDAEIKWSEFNQIGEHTGTSEKLKIPVAALKASINHMYGELGDKRFKDTERAKK
jgi:broad specificity phosphatase PhoE